MNCLLKHVIEEEMEGRIEVTEDGDKDVSNHLKTRKKSGY
jgi:hypothetical protein